MQGAMQAIYTEFERLRRMSVGGTVADARSDRNVRLNRYSNVLPYDANRVRLLNTAKNYINASMLESPIGEQPKWRYIATQVGLARSLPNPQRLHCLVQNMAAGACGDLLSAALRSVCREGNCICQSHLWHTACSECSLLSSPET